MQKEAVGVFTGICHHTIEYSEWKILNGTNCCMDLIQNTGFQMLV